jgi:glycosyltransferase involved in cell wall biosynthesis
VHWGWLEARRDYLELMASCDLVVSTARHEFFGVAVLEAVRAGCFPVLPDRLAYPELFPTGMLYRDGQLAEVLGRRIEAIDAVRREDLRGLAARYEWPRWEGAWRELLTR